MKRIVCEMCGSSDLIKKDGVYICECCGSKYSTEEAKKLMVELDGPVTVQVDESGKIENYLSMARGALENKNNKEAEDYCNRILETDQKNSEAWLIKAEASGWQSTLARPRVDEALSCLEKAVASAEKDDIVSVYSRAYDIMQNVLLSMGVLKLNHLVDFPKQDGLLEFYNMRSDLMTKAVCSDVAMKSYVKGLFPAEEVDAMPELNRDCTAYHETIDSLTVKNAKKIWDNAMSRYHKDQYPSDYAFEECMQQGLFGILLLESLVPAKASDVKEEKKAFIISVLEQSIKMHSTFRELKSYRTDFSNGRETHPVSKQFNFQKKQEELDIIAKHRAYILELDPEHKVPKTSGELEAEKKQAAVKAREDKKASRNKGLCALLALIDTALCFALSFSPVPILLSKARIRSELSFNLISLLIYAILFGVVITVVAVIGLGQCAKTKKKVNVVLAVLLGVIFILVFQYVTGFLLTSLYRSFGHKIHPMYTVSWSLITSPFRYFGPENPISRNMQYCLCLVEYFLAALITNNIVDSAAKIKASSTPASNEETKE